MPAKKTSGQKINNATEKTVEARILSWLKKQGYPLELRVGNAFRAAGWHVAHAMWFTDPETGKSRELDLTASRIGLPVGAGINTFQLTIAVECKKSTDKPWVVFAPDDREPNRAAFAVQLSAPPTGPLIEDFAFSKRVQLPSLLRAPRYGVGHGVVRAFADNRSGDPTAAFAACHSVASAASSIAHESANDTIAYIVEINPQVELVMPLVVTDAELFIFQVSGDQESLKRTDTAYINFPMGGTSATGIITLVTEKALPAFIQSRTSDVDTFLNAMAEHVEELAKKVADDVRVRAGSVPEYLKRRPGGP